MNWTEYIEAKPGVITGKPAIKGTRIGVDLILEKMAYGDTIEDIQAAYPHLTLESIRACLAYATAMIRNEETYFLTPAA